MQGIIIWEEQLIVILFLKKDGLPDEIISTGIATCYFKEGIFGLNTKNGRKQKVKTQIEQICKERYNEIIKRSKELNKDTHPDVISDLIATRIKSFYFNNFQKAKYLSDNFVADNYNFFKSTPEQDLLGCLF